MKRALLIAIALFNFSAHAQFDRAAVLAIADVAEDSSLDAISKRDILVGPQDEKNRYTFLQPLNCTYAKHDGPSGGLTPKFYCIPEGKDKDVKVKYGQENGEVYAEVAASRLYWALGFGADRNYAVTVKCLGCPEHPWEGIGPTSDRLFDPATVESKYPGKTVEDIVDQGWSFAQVESISQNRSEEFRAQLDAMKLLTAFIQNADAGPKNNRISCLDSSKAGDDGKKICHKAILLNHDLGFSFGRVTNYQDLSTAKMHFDAWKSAPVWKDVSQCQAYLPMFANQAPQDPVITPAGAKYLADRLGQLTHEQIENIFKVSRAEMADGHSAAEWAAVFEAKRSELVAAPCTH